MRPRDLISVSAKTFAKRHPYASRVAVAGMGVGALDVAATARAVGASRAARTVPLQSVVNRLGNGGDTGRGMQRRIPIQDPRFDFGGSTSSASYIGQSQMPTMPAMRSTGFHNVPFTSGRTRMDEEEEES